MSIAMLDQAAERLGSLCERAVFLGGASLALWIDDPAAPEPRVTTDVDVIVVVNSTVGYYAIGDELRDRGFSEDVESGIICRWRHPAGVILDVMPTEAEILGFTNRWYAAAIEGAALVTLPSGRVIRAVTPAFLLATKLEAFRGRGNDDMLGSVDFEDIVRLVDGRQTLVGEVETAPSDVRGYLSSELNALTSDERFRGALAGALMPDAASQARLPFVSDRFAALASTSD